MTIEWELDATSVTAHLMRDGVAVAGRACDLRSTPCEYGADADGRRGEMRCDTEVEGIENWGAADDLTHLPDENEMLEHWEAKYNG